MRSVNQGHEVNLHYWTKLMGQMEAENAKLRAALEAADLAGSKLLKENERLRAILEECANDLDASVNAEYAGTLDYPSQKRKWERDMEPVVKARKALAEREE